MNLRDLLEHEVQDLYSAETQIIEALPKMAEQASDSQLKKAFQMHLEQTREQKKRLEQVAKKMGFKPEGEKCKGMEGLLKEGQSVMKEIKDKEVLDAALIGAAQRVEHYEIAGYGTARYYAKMLGENEVERLLGQTLEEEKDTDEKLNDIAIERVNQKAQKA